MIRQLTSRLAHSRAAALGLALAATAFLGASWTATPAAPAASPAMPQFVIDVEAPVMVIDRVGGIVIRIDPPELSAVFPVLP